MTEEPRRSEPPEPAEAGEEDQVEDLEAPAETQEDVAGGHKCECAATTVV